MNQWRGGAGAVDHIEGHGVVPHALSDDMANTAGQWHAQSVCEEQHRILLVHTR